MFPTPLPRLISSYDVWKRSSSGPNYFCLELTLDLKRLLLFIGESFYSSDSYWKRSSSGTYYIYFYLILDLNLLLLIGECEGMNFLGMGLGCSFCNCSKRSSTNPFDLSRIGLGFTGSVLIGIDFDFSWTFLWSSSIGIFSSYLILVTVSSVYFWTLVLSVSLESLSLLKEVDFYTSYFNYL